MSPTTRATSKDIFDHILNNVLSQPPDSTIHQSFQCTICDASFNQKKRLHTHLTTVHENTKQLKTNLKKCVPEGKTPFKCEICGATFSQKGNVKAHITAVHEREKPFKCTACNKQFSQKGNLKTHVAAIHERKKPFT